MLGRSSFLSKVFACAREQAHFDAVVSAAGGSIRAARVAKRKGPDGKPLSSGFGFVECSSEDVAKIAIQKQQVGFCPMHTAAVDSNMELRGEFGQGVANVLLHFRAFRSQC